jgi:hypothetical protein
MPWNDDVREVPELEPAPEREAIELVGEDARLLGRLAHRLGMRPVAVVRFALVALARGGRDASGRRGEPRSPVPSGKIPQ